MESLSTRALANKINCRTPSPMSKKPPSSPLIEKSKFAPQAKAKIAASKFQNLLPHNKSTHSPIKRSFTPLIIPNNEELKVYEKPTTVDDYELLQIIGAGCYGTVKLGKRKSDGKAVAVKIIDKEYAIKMGQEKNLFDEKYYLSTLHHPYVPK